MMQDIFLEITLINYLKNTVQFKLQITENLYFL